MKPMDVPATVEVEHVSSNKSDKWKIENPLKRLPNNTSSGAGMHSHHQLHSSNNNHLSNGTLTSKSSLGLHHGSTSKKTDAPMLNLVYDSHFKQRHPDFR
jgi:hypothetical protein